MSTTLFLTKFARGSDGRYIESESLEIERAPVGAELLNTITLFSPLAELTVYEGEGDVDKSTVECFQDENISAIVDSIEAEFRRRLAASSAGVSAECELSEVMAKFREITNVYFLFKLKLEKYPDDDSVIVQLG
ncbi:hypothetical protein [Burkholderia cenocepacia]|uniref:hypothetical protein n=1 Tax=Burkholderia cenocepacia TaxID=95486 RepID=UPI00396B0B5F